MKKTTILTLLGSLALTAPLMASNVDVYITGSTAFRNNASLACSKLFDSTPTYNNSVTGGGTTAYVNTTSPSDKTWTMQGTAVNKGFTTGVNTLTIHALFNGSVQGLAALSAPGSTALNFNTISGTVSAHAATLAFSDVDSSSTLFPLNQNTFTETYVAVQPFVWCKSVTTVGPVTSITNISWEQAATILPSGTAPLSLFTGKVADDTTNVIYLLHRNKDSGTRVTTLRESKFIGNPTVWYWDPVNTNYFSSTNLLSGAPSWAGAGYIGGGDVANVLGTNNPANQAIGYLSLADAKKIPSTVSSGSFWSQVITYNGNLPTANSLLGVTTTNDFSPLITGKYPFWAKEVLAIPNDLSAYSSPGIDYTTLNNIYNLLTAQPANLAATPIVGSIDNEIYLTETSSTFYPNTAVRLLEMLSDRQSVGGTITTQ